MSITHANENFIKDDSNSSTIPTFFKKFENQELSRFLQLPRRKDDVMRIGYDKPTNKLLFLLNTTSSQCEVGFDQKLSDDDFYIIQSTIIQQPSLLINDSTIISAYSPDFLHYIIALEEPDQKSTLLRIKHTKFSSNYGEIIVDLPIKDALNHIKKSLSSTLNQYDWIFTDNGCVRKQYINQITKSNASIYFKIATNNISEDIDEDAHFLESIFSSEDDAAVYFKQLSQDFKDSNMDFCHLRLDDRDILFRMDNLAYFTDCDNTSSYLINFCFDGINPCKTIYDGFNETGQSNTKVVAQSLKDHLFKSKHKYESVILNDNNKYFILNQLVQKLVMDEKIFYKIGGKTLWCLNTHHLPVTQINPSEVCIDCHKKVVDFRIINEHGISMPSFSIPFSDFNCNLDFSPQVIGYFQGRHAIVSSSQPLTEIEQEERINISIQIEKALNPCVNLSNIWFCKKINVSTSPWDKIHYIDLRQIAGIKINSYKIRNNKNDNNESRMFNNIVLLTDNEEIDDNKYHEEGSSFQIEFDSKEKMIDKIEEVKQYLGDRKDKFIWIPKEPDFSSEIVNTLFFDSSKIIGIGKMSQSPIDQAFNRGFSISVTHFLNATKRNMVVTKSSFYEYSQSR